MEKIKKRTYDIINLGTRYDLPSKLFDYFIVSIIIINLFITLFSTFDESLKYKNILNIIELITMIIFAIEYGLRFWTAEYLYPKETTSKAKLLYVFSFFGIIDLMTFLPYFLPMQTFATGAIAFRMLRVFRIFRLFKINAQYDSFNVIVEVLNEKRNQIFSSLILIIILMISSSLIMYGLEHDAQPEAFANAFSGIWWSVSTLLTVGYGDIYPITTLGKIMAIIIAFLGVGMVAIPTGIISAGFVEHYTKIKTMHKYALESDVKFVTIKIDKDHPWGNKLIKELNIPKGLILAIIIRKDEVIISKGDTKILFEDKLVLGANTYKEDIDVKMKEILIKEEHPWIGKQIKDLDISRQTIIIMIKRKNKSIIPHGTTIIKNGDSIIIYSKSEHLDGIDIEI